MDILIRILNIVLQLLLILVWGMAIFHFCKYYQITSAKVKEFLKRTSNKIKNTIVSIFKQEKRMIKTFMEYNSETNQQENIQNAEATEAMEKPKSVRRFYFFDILLILILIVFATLFTCKKAIFDYDGLYATTRLIYSDEHGLCLLITYHPMFQEVAENAKGFAITHIPFKELVSLKSKARSMSRDRDLFSKYMDNNFDFYKKSTLEYLSECFTSETFDIENRGKYFISDKAYLKYGF